MPRTGGVYNEPAGTKGTPNTTIQSAPYNAFVDDLVGDANAARPVTAGGTGATTASGARTALGVAIGSNVQAYDALLQSIAGLTTSADQLIYTTGVDSAAVTAITAFGRSLVDDADAAAARTTLGVAIGTNVQAYDADLTAFAAVTIAANQIAYGTGAATWGVTSLTAFARSILDDNSAAEVQTTLGLGSLATKSSINDADWSGTALAVANGGTGGTTQASVFVQPAVAVARAATTDIGAAASFFLSLTGTTTITSLGTTAAGTLRLVQFAGAGTLTNNANIILPTAANITTAANDFALFRSEGAGVWRCVWYRGALVTADWTTGTKTTPGMPTPAQIAAAVAALSGWTVLGPIATTSGTAIDVTGIPTGVTDIEVEFVGVSTAGANSYMVQLGVSGSPVTSGYDTASSGGAAAASTAGFVIWSNTAAVAYSGILKLTKVDTDTWVSSHAMARLIAGSTISGGGHAVISGTINMLRLRSVPGTEAFDAGSIYVRYR